MRRHTTVAIALVGIASAVTLTSADVTAATAPVATDTFTRTASGGWGSADLGGAWSETGSDTRWAVSSGKGTFTMDRAGVGASNHLAISAADVSGLVDLSIDKTPTGGGVHLSVAARTNGTTEYRFNPKLLAGGSVRLGLSRVVNGSETSLVSDAAISGLSYVKGDVLRVRFQATGTAPTTLKAKVWKAGATEPSAFQVTATDSTSALQKAGGVGIASYLSGSATNAPVKLSVDGLSVNGTSSTSTSLTTTTTTTSTSTTTATTSTASTLINANFDALPTGRISAANFRAQLGGGNTNEAPYEDSTVVADSRGGKSYRLKLDANSYKNYPSGNNGIVTFIALKREVDQACVQYEIKFDSSFEWSLGGKLPGLQGTAPGVSVGTPTGGGYVGDKGWSARMMWLGPKAYSWAGPTNMAVSYLYSPQQESYYGDNVQWKKAFVAGKWHTVKQCHTMNTVGSANGKLQAWFDGVQVLNVTNYVYRKRSDVHIKHLNWSIFRGGGDKSWVASRTGYVDIDNVKVTTTS